MDAERPDRSKAKGVTMVEVMDRVVVESEKVGDPERTGVVTSISGSLIKVRWDSGEESAFVPGAGSLRVVAHEESESPSS
jgi:Domain of unknown function (DUF1918)